MIKNDKGTVMKCFGNFGSCFGIFRDSKIARVNVKGMPQRGSIPLAEIVKVYNKSVQLSYCITIRACLAQ